MSRLSKQQVEAIAAFIEDVLIIFDGDEASREGAKRLAMEFAPHVYVRILDLADGVKPDTMDLSMIEFAT